MHGYGNNLRLSFYYNCLILYIYIYIYISFDDCVFCNSFVLFCFVFTGMPVLASSVKMNFPNIYNSSLFLMLFQWNLVCSRTHYANIQQSILMFGVLLGNIIFGNLADRYKKYSFLFIKLSFFLSLSLSLF